jgi:hypothetical protein
MPAFLQFNKVKVAQYSRSNRTMQSHCVTERCYPLKFFNLSSNRFLALEFSFFSSLDRVRQLDTDRSSAHSTTIRSLTHSLIHRSPVVAPRSYTRSYIFIRTASSVLLLRGSPSCTLLQLHTTVAPQSHCEQPICDRNVLSSGSYVRIRCTRVCVVCLNVSCVRTSDK